MADFIGADERRHYRRRMAGYGEYADRHVVADIQTLVSGEPVVGEVRVISRIQCSNLRRVQTNQYLVRGRGDGR